MIERLFEMSYSISLMDMMFKIREFQTGHDFSAIQDPEFKRIFNWIKDDWPTSKEYLGYDTIKELVEHEIQGGRAKKTYDGLTLQQQDSFWRLVDYFTKLVETTDENIIRNLLLNR
jgi:hypothetical protein